MTDLNNNLEDLLNENSSLEDHIAQVTSMDLPLDWENVFEHDVDASSIHVESAADGLVLSLANLGRVDIEYISKISDIPVKDVIKKLKGSIYQDPDDWNECFYKGWKTADEYLSGNLLAKLKKAKVANEKYNGYFNDNVTTITNILPKGISFDDIYITLSSPWIPHQLIIDFVKSITGIHQELFDRGCAIFCDPITGVWEIKIPPYYLSYQFQLMFGTKSLNAIKLIEKTLNVRTISIKKDVYDYVTRKYKKVFDKEETLIALDKQRQLNDYFKDWVYEDDARKEMLEDAYNNSYGYTVARIYNGDFLSFPGLNPKIKLYPYQRNAVARIIFNKNTLLAHNVGTGKTYIMVAAGEELIRMKLSKKNMYVVPNSILKQWQKIYKSLYPKSKIKVCGPSSFSPLRKIDTLYDIQQTDYNAIIIAASCFDRIKISRTLLMKKLNDKLAEAFAAYNQNPTDSLDNYIDSLEKKIKDLQNAPYDPEDHVSFDKLGITRLFVDEAHNYKNVPISTGIIHVMGINSAGSKKCEMMKQKVNYMNSTMDCGVIMATGTPITNSVTDAFVFQSYLQPGELKLLNLDSFDSWVSMFAEKHEEFEVDVDASGYRLATRFSRFHNLPELTSILANVADFYGGKDEDMPNFKGHDDIVIPKSQELSDYITSLSIRSDKCRSGQVKRKDDNMLKITTDGRKAALDLRLIDVTTTADPYQSKAYKCASIVYDIYQRTKDDRLTQLIFCDSSTPKDGFNIYDEIKYHLMCMGVQVDEIAYIHDATSDRKREQLFERVRNGNVRILIGSTSKLGLGVNVQDKLVALHHVDVPWRPADMVQREGRILRQGNQNEEVYIFRYVSAGSFDAYSWQLLETKQHFINELLSNSLSERSKEDIADTVLNYGEVKALAIANPLLKERFEASNELNKLRMLERKQKEQKVRYEIQLLEIPERIEELNEVIANLTKDIELYNENKVEHTNEEKLRLRSLIFEKLQSNELREQEEIITSYQGFDIVLPTHMLTNKKFVWLKGNTRHQVMMADTEIGCLVRIDNFLDKLDEKLTKTYEEIDRLNDLSVAIQEEMKKEFNYQDRIIELRQIVEELDARLEEENNEDEQ